MLYSQLRWSILQHLYLKIDNFYKHNYLSYFMKVARQDSKTQNIANKLSTVREEYQTLEHSRVFHNRLKNVDLNSSCSNIKQSFPSIKSSHVHRRPHRSLSSHLKISTYKSATILISMVILFLLTHFYRVTLKIYEITTPKNNMKDFKYCISKDRWVKKINVNMLYL